MRAINKYWWGDFKFFFKKIYFRIIFFKKIWKYYECNWDIVDSIRDINFELFKIFIELLKKVERYHPIQYGIETEKESEEIFRDYENMYQWIVEDRQKLIDILEKRWDNYFKKYPTFFEKIDGEYSRLKYKYEYLNNYEEIEKQRKKDFQHLQDIEKDIQEKDKEVLEKIIKYKDRMWD